MPEGLKLNLKTGVDNWGLGEWPEDLLKCATLKTEAAGNNHWSVKVGIDYKDAERVTRKIIKETIEVFFEEEVYISIVSGGIQICCLHGDAAVIVPFNFIDVLMKGSERDALVKMLNEMEFDEGDEGEFKYLDEIQKPTRS